MPKFTYVVKDLNGNTIRDIADAFDQAVLIDRLQKQGFFIVSIDFLQEKGASLTSAPPAAETDRRIKFAHGRVHLDDLLVFCRQMATMLEAGVTILRSLSVVVTQVESKQFYEVLQKVRADVEQGSSLSLSISKHPKVFDQFWVSLVEVGEASGTMPVIMERLAQYLEQQNEFNTAVTSALIYPIILFVVSMGAISFFALFVGPRFQEIFKTMGAQLPLITTMLLNTFDFIRKNILIMIGIFVAVIFAIKSYVKTYRGKLNLEKFLFRLPKIGQVYKLVIVERFTSQLALLIESGVPILYSLDIVQKLVSNNTCALVVEDMKEGVKRGELIVTPMQRTSFFPNLAVQMIMVGEETGELSKMLQHVAAFYKRSVEITIKRLGTIIEPFMIVFMGGIVGVILIAMFLPLFNIASLGRG